MPTFYREATYDDRVAIATLHAESWRATYRGFLPDDYLEGPVYDDRMSVWGQRLSAPAGNQFVVVAADGDRVAGFACAYGADDARWGTLLDNIHVRRELHGRGIGAALVAEITDWCRANHPDLGLYLWVVAANGNARRFYEGLGGTDVGGEVRVPSAGAGEPREVRRYAWTSLDDIGRPSELAPVERASSADEADIIFLLDEAATWLQAQGIDQWKPGRFTEEVSTAVAAGEMYLARMSGAIVGCFCLARGDPDSGPDALYLSRLAVSRAAAGHSLGRRLLDEATRIAAEAGFESVRLDCWAGNLRLRKYYLDAGFEHLGDFRAPTRDRDGEDVDISFFDRRTVHAPTRDQAG